ncbi:MAG: hypothetical protein HY538_00835 [Deltaproteobacteria bacterium]|nr:hypothetical protein [Deltaproteobacteria bacterium]
MSFRAMCPVSNNWVKDSPTAWNASLYVCSRSKEGLFKKPFTTSKNTVVKTSMPTKINVGA